MAKEKLKFEIAKGDTIKFTVNTRSGRKTATRVVNGFWDETSKIPTVEFEGWKNFVVNHTEIIEHIRK